MAVKRGRAAAFSVFKNKKKEDKKTGASSKPQSSASSNKQNNNNQSSNVPRRAQGYTSSAQRGRQNNPTQRNIQTTASNRVAQSQNSRANTPTSAYQKQKATASTSAEMRKQREQNSGVQSRRNQSVSGMNQRMNRTATAKDMAEQKNRNTASTAANMRRQQEYEKMAEKRKQNLPSSSREDRVSHRNEDRQNLKPTKGVERTAKVTSKAVKDAFSGYGQTALDIKEKTHEAQAHGYVGRGDAIARLADDYEEKEKERKARAEKYHTAKADETKKLREKLNEKQQERQKEWDEEIKDVKGLEKAWYGAVESGVGMGIDIGVGTVTGGVGTLPSMAARTYGTTRGSAEREGATESEDRLYSLLQAGKEVGTEKMFRGAGLASEVVGGKGLSVGGKLAGRLTRNLTGKKADVVGAGIKLAGGVGEENVEEAAGWGLDPIIKELSYGKKIRERTKAELASGLEQPKTIEEAEYIVSQLNSDSYLKNLEKQYEDSGLSKKQAKQMAKDMRDYYSAFYEGNDKKFNEIGDKIAGQMSGSEKLSRSSWNAGELVETFAATSLLTGLTGAGGVVSSASKGAAMRDALGSKGLMNLAKSVSGSEDAKASERGKDAQKALEENRTLTATQVYDLSVAASEQYEKDTQRQNTAIKTAGQQIKANNYVAPYGVDDNGVIHMEEATRESFKEASTDAKSKIQSLLKENKDSKASMTVKEIDEGANAIAGFKTGIFTVDDANALNYNNDEVRKAFTEATGIDLKDYVVKNRDGSVNIAKTNAATKEALFAQAADNLVATAQAETAHWMDKAKGEVVTQVTARMGSQGSVALQEALDDVDERDSLVYRTVANASDYVYQSARNVGLEWSDVAPTITEQFKSIAPEKLKAMYEAGLDDRQAAIDSAKDKAAGYTVKAGQPMRLEGEKQDVTKGKVFIDSTDAVEGTTIRVFSEIAKNLGVDIHLVDNLDTKTEDGKTRQVNGMYANGDIYINVNSDFESNLGYIFTHEVTHHLKSVAPEQFMQLENLVREKWFNYNADQMQSEIAKKIKSYAGKQTLTEEMALEEIIADAAHEFLNDRNFANAIAEENPSLAKALLDSIKHALRMLRRIFSSGTFEPDETHMNSLFSQLDILEEAERLWLGAYTQAVANQAAVAIDVKQDEMNVSSYSLGYHAGDLGKSRVDDYAGQSYGRDTGHFGFGTYFVGNTDNFNYSGYADRNIETVEFDNYNLFTPRTEQQAFDLHNALRVLDGFAQDYSEFSRFTNRTFDHSEEDEKVWNEQYYITKQAVDDADGVAWDLFNGYEIDEAQKKRIDDYIASLPIESRENIARMADRDYTEAQKKDASEEAVRERLAENYDLNEDYFKSSTWYKDPISKEDYIEKELQSTIDNINTMKEKPKEYWYYEAAETEVKREAEHWGKKYDRFNHLEWNLRSALNYKFSDAEIKDALKKTEEVVKGYGSRSDAERGLDSPATVFMKELGFEGVDVRHLPLLDTTGFGSVIYDLKGEDLARKNEIGTARFSMSEPVEKSGDLIAVHNLSEDKLRGDFRLGGFPMPSIAVTNQNHEDFGEISLLFGSDTIDPKKDKANKVYSADAWTPTVPMTEYEADSDVANKAYRTIKELVEGSGVPTSGMSADFHYDNIQDSLGRERGFDGFITRMMEKPYIKYAFLKSQGVDIEVPYKEGSLQGHGKDVWDKLDEALPEMTKSEAVNMDNDEAMKLEPIIREIVAEDWINQKEALDIDEEKLRNLNPYKSAFSWGKVTRYLSDLVKFREEGKTIQVVDEKALENVLNDNIDKNAYREWMSNLFDGIVKDSGVRNQTDPFTPSGNRRSFKATHHPATLEGILRAMKEQGEKNVSYHTSTKTLRADTAKTFKSLDEIRKDKGKLQDLSENEVETIYKELDDKFYGILDSIGEKSSREYDLYSADIIADVMSECAKAGYTKPEQIIKHYDNYEWTVSEQDAKDILALFDAIQNMPVNMFEAKPRRAVGFNEVRAAIVPDDTSEDILNELELMEIPVTKYSREVEGDRVNKVNEVAKAQDIRFSLASTLDADYMAAVESKNINDILHDVGMEEVHELVDKAAKAAGYNEYVFHGTGGEFTEFDESRAGANHGNWSKYGKGFYFSDSEDTANYWGNNRKMIKAYIKLKNPYIIIGLEMTSEGPLFEAFNKLRRRQRLTTREEEFDDYMIAYLNEKYGKDYTTNLLKEHGYDGIIVEHPESEDRYSAAPWSGTVEYIVFDAENIKSAEAVTFDDDLSIIPLSERFNPENKDIRYSMPTQDSEGKVLTDGQMEYFKNSQARDDQGKLVPVYHTTRAGGFTIFDPSFSDDRKSLFFTDLRRMSESYAKEDGRPTGNIDPYNPIGTNVRKIENVNALPSFDSSEMEEDIRNRISNISVVDANGASVIEGDDFVETAIKIAEIMESEGLDLYEDFGIKKDRLINDTGWQMGEAWEVFNNAFEVNLQYKMDYEDTVGTYNCYLNLENPLIIDCANAYWSSILEDGFKKISTRPVPDSENEYFVTLQSANVVKDHIMTLDQIAEIYDEDMARQINEYDWANKSALNNVDFYTYAGNEFDPEEEGVYPQEGDTRFWCDYAWYEGYDGVIFENVRDYGDSGYGNEPGNVYVAFSSNQVKDVNNENPTENPDIRYSIVDEDEVKARQDRQFAYDNSYEALMHYEEMFTSEDASEEYDLLNDKDVEAYYRKAKRFVEKDVDAFYSGLTPVADRVVTDDPVLEEGRVRMARSKEDFFNSNIAKWNDRWLTDGTVLDVESVKKEVRDLVMAMMQNSDTDRQYKTGLVNKTLIDMRLAYDYAKRGQTDIASAILWHSAQKMIDNVEFYREDDSYATYKDLRDYLRTTKISLGSEYWSDVAGGEFGRFRKKNYGRLKLVKGSTDVDQIYQELEERWPEWFNTEEQMTPPDMLEQISHVLDVLQPVKEAYSSEEAAEVTQYIAEQLTDIMDAGKELHSLADDYKKRLDEKTKAMKLRHEEAMRKVREQRDKGIKAEKAKWQVKEEKRKERASHKKAFKGIEKSYKTLTERLFNNTADSHIPQQYKKELAGLLACFDMQTEGSKKREARTGHVAQKTIKLSAIKTALSSIENNTQLFHVNDAITDIIDALLGIKNGSPSESIDGLTIDELSVTELAKVDKLLKALVHEFNNYEKVRVGTKKQQAADIGKAQVDSALEHAKTFGSGKDYQNIPGFLDNIINLDEMTPAYMFRRIDPENNGLGLMWKEIRRSFDKYVTNQNQLNEWIDDIVGKYHKNPFLLSKYGAGELVDWRSENYSQVFNLANGTIQLTPAQMMSVYCLSKRAQAMDHMTGAGIVVAPVSYNAKILSDLKKKANTALPVQLTDADIKQIIDALTPEQIKVADELQELLSTKMAQWGNEASMDVIGIELFNEKDYFPIRSDRAALTKDLNEEEFAEAIRNFGFTKAVQPGARNAIMVDDIFNVVTEHCNNMNLYNSYSATINDFMKVYNYRDFREDGSEYTVQQAIAHAYSKKATTFLMTFIRDLNGNVSGRPSGIESMYNGLLANAKKASVFANLRVAAQQPTAIIRAFAEIDAKYIKGIKIEKGAMQEMFDHCPIALWKSWGYYDINMGKSIEDIMMNEGKILEDVATDLYGALDNVTWTAIWQMVKNEMKDTHPDVEVGTDEYWELCNERMSEIVDLTQVVDSPMHRSHAMRDRGFFHKMTTSFMAEPTLTFNMVKAGYVNAYELYKTGNKKDAAKKFTRTSAVFLLQAAAVSAAAGFVDALRGKGAGDDDDDENKIKRILRLWWKNLAENFIDEMKPYNKIYVLKDIASLFEGWENRNLALQGFQMMSLGWRQLTGDPYARSSKSWYENLFGGLGYLTGIPAKTMMTGLENAMDLLGVKIPAIDNAKARLDKIAEINKERRKESGDEGGYFAQLFSMVMSDEKTEASASTNTDTDTDTDTDSGSGSSGKGGMSVSYEDDAQALYDASRDYDVMLADAQKAAEGYEGEERNKRIWQSVSKDYKKYMEIGDIGYLEQMRDVVEEMGGDLEYFDERMISTAKSTLKKSLSYESGDADLQARIGASEILRRRGVSENEISEVCYKSEMAKDVKIALRLGDEQMILESAQPLVDAGLTDADWEKLWKNRNRLDIEKYKGKYKDMLKSTGKYIWPTEGTITSHFGRRNAPTAGASSNHPAIDIGAAEGTPVLASDGGVVITAGKNGGYGNSVGIKHDNGMVTYYNHLYGWNVKEGDVVMQGQQIGQVGSTGISTGPHLDFKILDINGNAVDPEQYLQ